MRCYCCDKELSDYEATLRICSTDEFADTCLKCLQGLSIATKGNGALKRKPDELLEETEEQSELESLIRQQRADDWDSDD